MSVTFSPNFAWDDDRKSILLSAMADGKRIRCVIPQEFLTAPLAERLSEPQARGMFDRRRPKIERLLRERIEEGSVGPEGEIILA